LTVSQAFAFTVISNAGKPAHWADTMHIGYHYYNVPSDFIPAMENSFQAWMAVSGVAIAFQQESDTSSPSSSDGKNTLSWIESKWTDLSFRPPSNALAVTLSSFDSSTGAISDADIYFNAQDFNWAIVESSQDSAFIDVQNIATHEIGHLIGLDHSSNDLFETDPDLADATMFYASGSGESSRREPHADDIKGIRALYPAEDPPAVKIDSVEETQVIGNIHLYSVKGENFSDETEFILTKGDNSIADAVSRYRTITSSTEAEVQLDLTGFPSGDVTFVAFNDPSHLSTYALGGVVTANSDSSSSGGGSGGGCALQSPETSHGFAFILFFTFILLLCLRRSKQKR